MFAGGSPTRSQTVRRVLGAGVAVTAAFGLASACRQDPPSNPVTSPKSTPADPAVAATCKSLYPALGPRFPGEVSNQEAIERTTAAYRNALATAPTDLRTALLDLIEVSTSLSPGATTSLPGPLPTATSASAPAPKGASGGAPNLIAPNPTGTSTSAQGTEGTAQTDGTTTTKGTTGTTQGPTNDRLSRAIEQQAALEGWYQAYCP